MAEGREGHGAMVRVWFFVVEGREGRGAMVREWYFVAEGRGAWRMVRE